MSTRPTGREDRARPKHEVPELSLSRLLRPLKVDRWRWEAQYRRSDLGFVGKNNKDESRRLLPLLERSLRAPVHVAPAVELRGQQRAQRGQGRSSAPGGQPAYNPARGCAPTLFDRRLTLSTE